MPNPFDSPAGQARRLSAEMRSKSLRICPEQYPAVYEDALHDLDIADKEMALMDTLYDQSQEALREQASELAGANSQIAACALEMMRVGWKRGETIGAIQRGSPPEYCLFCEADYPNHTSGCICQDIEAFAASYTAQAIAQARREALERAAGIAGDMRDSTAWDDPSSGIEAQIRALMDAPAEEECEG